MKNQIRKQILDTYGFPDLYNLSPIIDELHSKKFLPIPTLMREQKRKKTLSLQARYGFGEHEKMLDATTQIRNSQAADVYTMTIDSFTRNLMFKKINSLPSLSSLNGYPLVTHGIRKTSEIVQLCNGTIEVRHGSPDPRILAEVSLASGVTGFEGGPISYTLPYSKKFPLDLAFDHWKYTNDLVAFYQSTGIEIERETFGTLTAVMVPPCISLVVNLIEVIHMIQSGVQCINISYCQSGSIAQDFATKIVLDHWLKIIVAHFSKYQPEFFFTFHVWMAPFPTDTTEAASLIDHGVAIARTIGMDRVILKTKAEAKKIPTIDDNIEILQHSKKNLSRDNYFLSISKSEVDEEVFWLGREVSEIMEVLLNQSQDIKTSACWMFKNGFLDIPFCPSIYSNGNVIPLRDEHNNIRYHSFGKLPFSETVKKFHKNRLKNRLISSNNSWLNLIERDIFSWQKKTI